MYKALSSELLWFPNLPIAEDMALAQNYGYRGIGFDIKSVSKEYKADAFAKLLEKHNLEPASFALPVEFRLDDDTFRADLEQLEAHCQYASLIQAQNCTAYILPYSDTLDYSINLAMYRERLRRIADLLEAYGLLLGLEFLGPPSLRKDRAHEFIHDLTGMLELLELVESPNLGHLLDAFHWDMAGQVYEDFARITRENPVVVAHLSDAPLGLSREEQPNHQRELPGATGVVNIKDFMEGLYNLRYEGPVFVEPFNAALRDLPFEEAVKAAKTAMDRVWIELVQ